MYNVYVHVHVPVLHHCTLIHVIIIYIVQYIPSFTSYKDFMICGIECQLETFSKTFWFKTIFITDGYHFRTSGNKHIHGSIAHTLRRLEALLEIKYN